VKPQSGLPIRTDASPPLLLRDDDTSLLVNVTVITEWPWGNQSTGRREVTTAVKMRGPA
jgi:hypothetical protein